MTAELNIIPAAAGILLSIISGYLLSSKGKPYKPLIFNIHKFIALAVFVYLIILLVQAFKALTPSPIIQYLIFLICMFMTGVFITGGILSAKEERKKSVAILHTSFSFLILAGAVFVIILLFETAGGS